MHHFITVLAVLLAAGTPEGKELQDTLQTSTVTAQRGITVSRNDVVHIEKSQTVADALQMFPTLQVSDIGGAAGLKTAGLRGLGSAHTGIFIDGIRVGNLQSGQTDLGILPMDTFGAATVDYAQNSISFTTAAPVFRTNDRIAGRAGVKGGSFGTWQPSARVDWRLTERTALSASASGTVSRGDFVYGDGLRREGNDISQWRGGLDAFGRIEGGEWRAKAFAGIADRGTPGSISWPSDDRQKDRNAFVQSSFNKRFGSYTLGMAAKASYDYIFYHSSWGDSEYGQKELQLNSSHLLRVTDRLTASVRTELQWDGLRSDYYDADRLRGDVAAGAAFKAGIFSADASLEWVGAFDKGHDSRTALEPSLDMRLTVAEGLDLVAFGRRAYRIPTFNELYYAGYGNPDLLCEDAWLSDAGIEWLRTVGGWTLNAKVNGFLYALDNKIMSAPSEADPNVWLPYNIGKVLSKGLDSMLSGRWSKGGRTVGLTARYSLLDAIDKTPDSYTYGQQVPYAARHSVVVTGLFEWSGWSLSSAFNLRSGRMDSYGAMPDWHTLDATLARSLAIAGGEAVVSLSGKNLTNRAYELSSGYPMPGRAVMAGIEIIF